MSRTARSLALALVAVAPFLSSVGCAPRVVIPDEERERIADELDGRSFFLRVATNAAPFFGDRTRYLLSDSPVEEVQLLESIGGDKISPPAAERVLLPGTRVRIRAIEFPTPWLIAKRIVMTPRYHPWAVLEVDREARPCVIVLPQGAVRLEDVKNDLDRLLVATDPTADYQALPLDQQSAIRKKELVEGMSLRAVEMAWGLPEKRRIDRPEGLEDWTWPEGRRAAHFKEDRLVKWERR